MLRPGKTMGSVDILLRKCLREQVHLMQELLMSMMKELLHLRQGAIPVLSKDPVIHPDFNPF